MSEKKQIELVYASELETFFSDMVRIDANPETVTLTFGIKSSDNTTAIARHKAIMTLPHFIRLADTCNKAAKEMMDKIEKAKKENK